MKRQTDNLSETTPSQPPRRAIRYASIDLLRGISIVIMLVLHAIMDTLDREYYISRLESGGLINLLALILLPLLGGLAGLFLLTSAIGNMVGMTRNLRAAHAPLAVMRKQVLGGLIIVMFAMVAEAVLGYHGAVGQLLLNLDDPAGTDFSPMYSQAWHMETLHTIGWATMINGITHCLLAARIDIERQTSRVIRIYWGLILLVLLITPIVWWLCSWLIPGYPFAINPDTGRPTYLPVIGTSSWQDLVLFFFINPLSAPVEPVLPYLATSYLGSIIGLQITRTRHSFDRRFAGRYFVVGLFCFLAGAVGFVGLLMNIRKTDSLDAMIGRYQLIYDHRFHTTEHSMPGGWFWQYLILTGAALMIAMAAFRLFELRGHGQKAAVRLAWIRRFGFIAFTIYTIQWVYFIVHYLVSIAMGLPPYAPLKWTGTWIVVALTLILLHLLTRVWEKCGYLGSAEWAIVSLTNCLSRIRKQVSSGDGPVRWYQHGQLDVNGVFYGPEWQNLDEIHPEEAAPVRISNVAAERRLIWWASLAGLVCFPCALVSVVLIRSFRRDHPQQSLPGPVVLTGIGLLLLALVTLVSGLSLTDLGLVALD